MHRIGPPAKYYITLTKRRGIKKIKRKAFGEGQQQVNCNSLVYSSIDHPLTSHKNTIATMGLDGVPQAQAVTVSLKDLINGKPTYIYKPTSTTTINLTLNTRNRLLRDPHRSFRPLLSRHNRGKRPRPRIPTSTHPSPLQRILSRSPPQRRTRYSTHLHSPVQKPN